MYNRQFLYVLTSLTMLEQLRKEIAVEERKNTLTTLCVLVSILQRNRINRVLGGGREIKPEKQRLHGIGSHSHGGWQVQNLQARPAV